MSSISSSCLQPVIGLEVHAQIASSSKLFSRAPASVFGQEPNTCVALVDLALPGMLPVVNEKCIHQGIRMGLAVQGHVATRSIFDRKHYFYADNPAGYQISQYTHPLVQGGQVPIRWTQGGQAYSKIIHLDRIHIEQDAGKILHDQDPALSYVDFNRAGIGLMEIVSKPELCSPEEAVAYIKQLRCLMRTLGVCYGDMEKGQLRVDVNVSVHLPGEPFGTRVEIKNMNSLRFLYQALTYEIDRQSKACANGETILQETRTFDPSSGQTRAMRLKEFDYDYCYFPDPDLKPLVIAQAEIDDMARTLPETPWQTYERFMQDLGLCAYDADILTTDSDVADFFQRALDELSSHKDAQHLPKPEKAKLIANWMTGEFFAALNRADQSIADCLITPTLLTQLVAALIRKDLSGPLAKEVFALMFTSGDAPDSIMDQKGLRQVSDPSQIQAWVCAVLDQDPAQFQAYLDGKDKLFGYFVGQVMKMSAGKASPEDLQKVLRQEIEKRR
jgi:aspartyl-tRNA(Asn)/glutamyl-tRNA(Gln) amidotransferase subunit B